MEIKEAGSKEPAFFIALIYFLKPVGQARPFTPSFDISQTSGQELPVARRKNTKPAIMAAK